MKICNKCHVEKEDCDFNMQKRFSKRLNEVRYYKNFACIICMREVSKANRIKHIDNNDYKAVKSEWQKRTYPLKPKVKLSENKLAINREYSKTNKEKLRTKRIERKRKYIKELSANYINELIKKELKTVGVIITTDEIPKELIELKHKQLKTWRILKELKN